MNFAITLLVIISMSNTSPVGDSMSLDELFEFFPIAKNGFLVSLNTSMPGIKPRV